MGCRAFGIWPALPRCVQLRQGRCALGGCGATSAAVRQVCSHKQGAASGRDPWPEAVHSRSDGAGGGRAFRGYRASGVAGCLNGWSACLCWVVQSISVSMVPSRLCGSVWQSRKVGVAKVTPPRPQGACVRLRVAEFQAEFQGGACFQLSIVHGVWG